jgi:hypothetical protein
MSNSKNIVAPTRVSGETFVKKKRLSTKVKPTLAGLTAATLGLSGIFLAATPASANPGYSAAEAQYLSGSLLDLSLDDVAAVEGQAATSPFGNTESDVQTGNLDLSALGDVITIQLADGVQIPVTLADAGVVGQYAEANPDGTSFAASGLVSSDGVVGVGPVPASPPGILSLDLSDLLDADITSQIANLNLTTNVNTATAEQNGANPAVGTYDIADLDVALNSPTVAGLSGTVSSSVTPLEETIDGVVGQNGSIVTSLTGLLSETGLVTSNVSLDVDLNPVVDDVLAQNQLLGADGPVTVNLADGAINVDVAALLAANGQDLNDLDPNTEVLNTQLATLITAEVDSLVNGLLTEVDEAVTTALNSAVLNLNVTIGDDPAAPLLTVAANGPLSDLADGTLLSTVTVGQDVDLDPALVNTTIQNVLNGVLGLEVDTAALDAALDGLYPAVDDVLTDVVSLTANNQDTTDGTFTETALRLNVLNFNDGLGQALNLNLAQASVGPNALVIDPANPDTVIVGFTPTSGPEAGGTPVTITGAGFTGATSVTFGGNESTEFDVISDTEIVATTPAGTGAVPVTVNGTQYGEATAPGDFTYVADGITSFTPNQGPEAGGTTVTLTGSGFADVTAVRFGDTPAATFNATSDTSITAVTSAGTGSVPITLVTPNGEITSTGLFTFVPAISNGTVVTSITPDEGPDVGGTPVTITGEGFTGTEAVLFDNGSASNVVVVNDNTITAVTPPGEGVAYIGIVNPVNGNNASNVSYTYLSAVAPTPDVTGVTPAEGPLTGGTDVTITGDNFTNVTEVLVNGVPATNVTIVNDNTITATTPAGVEAGAVDVTVGTADGATDTLAGGFTYVAAQAPAPTPGDGGTDGEAPGTDGGVIGGGTDGANNGNSDDYVGDGVFANCDAAAAAGKVNFATTDRNLDADGDGYGCENNGATTDKNGNLAYTGSDNLAVPMGLGIMALISGAGLLLARRFSF